MHTQQHQSRISWLPLHASKMHVLMGRWVVGFQLKSLRFRDLQMVPHALFYPSATQVEVLLMSILG